MDYNNKAFPPFEVNVLVIDDDATSLEITLRTLRSLNYKGKLIAHIYSSLLILFSFYFCVVYMVYEHMKHTY